MSKFIIPSFNVGDAYTPFAHQNEMVDCFITGWRLGENTLAEGPTGCGKSLVLANAGGVIHDLSGLPTLIVVPNMDLAQQDAIACARQRPDLKTTICCSKLGHRDISGQLVVATAGSLVRRGDLPKFGAVFIDEAHRLPPWKDSQLQTVIRMAREKNPNVVILGATATPYRMDGGSLTDGSIWSGVAMQIDYLRLMKAGLLAPLIGPVGAKMFRMDVAGLKKTAGDFNERDMDDRFNNAPMTAAMASDVIKLGADRRSWLLFCVSIAHARRMCASLRDRGINAAWLSHETPRDERIELLDKYRRGDIRALCSMALLTTGFDGPATDLLALCRPTQSVSLHVQILGRGSRTAPGKQNALVLDFAGNVARCGAINAPNIVGVGDRGAAKPAPKQCEDCGHWEPPHARACSNCGASLIKAPPAPKSAPALSDTADRNIKPVVDRAAEAQQVASQPNVFRVTGWKFSTHYKAGSPASLKIEYLLEGYRYRSASQWVTAWHKSGAAWHGQQAWAQLLKPDAPRRLPVSAEDAVVVASQMLKRPEYVRIVVENGFPSVTPIQTQRPAAA